MSIPDVRVAGANDNLETVMEGLPNMFLFKNLFIKQILLMSPLLYIYILQTSTKWHSPLISKIISIMVGYNRHSKLCYLITNINSFL